MKYKVTLNSRTYEVEVERGEAILVDSYEAAAAPAAAAAPVAAGEVVFSPMPGNIIQVKVTLGQLVKKGDVLLILEAMKMENEILAPRNAVVAQVIAARGTQVDSGAPLVVLS